MAEVLANIDAMEPAVEETAARARITTDSLVAIHESLTDQTVDLRSEGVSRRNVVREVVAGKLVVESPAFTEAAPLTCRVCQPRRISPAT